METHTLFFSSERKYTGQKETHNAVCSIFPTRLFLVVTSDICVVSLLTTETQTLEAAITLTDSSVCVNISLDRIWLSSVVRGVSVLYWNHFLLCLLVYVLMHLSRQRALKLCNSDLSWISEPYHFVSWKRAISFLTLSESFKCCSTQAIICLLRHSAYLVLQYYWDVLLPITADHFWGYGRMTVEFLVTSLTNVLLVQLLSYSTLELFSH